MEKIKAIPAFFKEYFSSMNSKKVMQLISIAIGAAGIIFAIYYFCNNCFNLSKSKFYNGYFAVILITMIALTIYMLRLLLTDKKWSYSRVYIILALGWSVCMQLVMPPITGPDEAKHYFSAYHASNLIMGIKDNNTDQGWVDQESYYIMRVEDMNNISTIDVTFPLQYEILADGNWFHCSDEGNQIQATFERPVEARRYLLSGLGIAIARWLNFGFVGTVFLGRFMNSLSLVLVGWFCIKIIPFGKAQIVSFAMLPTILELCGSYSYDNMSILCSLLFLTLCMYYTQPKVTLHAWDLFILAGTLLVLLPNKVVYILFAIWMIAIPIKKWWAVVVCKKWYEYAMVLAFIGGAAVAIKKYVAEYFWNVISTVFWNWGTRSIEQYDGWTAYTFWDLEERPQEVLSFAWSGIKSDFWYNIKCCVGYKLGYVLLNVEVPVVCTIILLVCFIAGVFVKKGNRLKKWQYAIIVLGSLICLAGVFLGCLVRFTPAEGSERVQVSYRYLIPIYAALVIAAGSDAKENKANLGLLYAQNVTLIFVMCNAIQFLFHLRDGM